MLFKDLSFIGKLIPFKISKRELVVGRRRANPHFFYIQKRVPSVANNSYNNKELVNKKSMKGYSSDPLIFQILPFKLLNGLLIYTGAFRHKIIQ